MNWDFVFVGGVHVVNVRVSGNRDILIASEKTGMKFVSIDKLVTHHNKRQVLLMKSKIKDISDDELKIYIVMEFKKMGYDLKKFNNG